MSTTPDPAVRPYRPSLKPENPVPRLEESRRPLPPQREIGGRKDGTEPTRYGDWEKQGRCIDF